MLRRCQRWLSRPLGSWSATAITGRPPRRATARSTASARWERYRTAKRDPHPRWSALLSCVRYRIDTLCGQLVDRCAVKRVWARDLWQLCGRLLRKVLMHSVTVLLNGRRGHSPLHLTQVVA